MDWFTNLGVYMMMFPGAPALAMDMALNPQVADADDDFKMAYHLQSAPEVFEVYHDFGPFGG